MSDFCPLGGPLQTERSFHALTLEHAVLRSCQERNVPLDVPRKKIHFYESNVCKYALGGLCPHGLFRNTRSDLGRCLRFAGL